MSRSYLEPEGVGAGAVRKNGIDQDGFLNQEGHLFAPPLVRCRGREKQATSLCFDLGSGSRVPNAQIGQAVELIGINVEETAQVFCAPSMLLLRDITVCLRVSPGFADGAADWI
jgi:hypothetical protein